MVSNLQNNSTLLKGDFACACFDFSSQLFMFVFDTFYFNVVSCHASYNDQVLLTLYGIPNSPFYSKFNFSISSLV